MHLFRKHISRRTVLKGVGATIALPLIDAMNPAATAWAKTAAGTAPKRLAVVGERPEQRVRSQVARFRHGLLMMYRGRGGR